MSIVISIILFSLAHYAYLTYVVSVQKQMEKAEKNFAPAPGAARRWGQWLSRTWHISPYESARSRLEMDPRSNYYLAGTSAVRLAGVPLITRRVSNPLLHCRWSFLHTVNFQFLTMSHQFEPLKNDLILRTARGSCCWPLINARWSNFVVRREGGAATGVGDATR